MGEIREAAPAALVCAVTFRDDAVRDAVLARFSARYGPVALRSPVFEFDMTDYYTPEMGPGLRKQFVCFQDPFRPETLASVKLFTDEIESDTGTHEDGALHRSVNLDPGYVTLAKLVLASAKDFSHRIYLDRGIYAEVTLRYKGGTFYPIETTFPDYKQALSIAFFNEARDYVKRNRDIWTR